MQFEWDERKNEINLVKHDLDFVDAELVFGGPMLQALAPDQDYGEERWIAIGLLEAIVVFVVFTRREPDIIRIISMRKATQHEKSRFESALQDQLGGA